MKPRFRLRRAPPPGDASPDAPAEGRTGYVLEPVSPAASGPVDEALLAALSDDIDATLDDELFPTLTEVIAPDTDSLSADREAVAAPNDPLALADAIASADLGDITDLTDILDVPDGEPAAAQEAQDPHRANWDAALQRTQTELLERLLLRSDELIDVQLRHALAAELAGRCDELVAETRDRFDRLGADLQSALSSMVSELVVRMVEDELDRMRALQPGPPRGSTHAQPPAPSTEAPTVPPSGGTASTPYR